VRDLVNIIDELKSGFYEGLCFSGARWSRDEEWKGSVILTTYVLNSLFLLPIEFAIKE
jgi:hypothetical protein